MKHRVDAIVKCPYYKCEERQLLFCEGVQEGTALHLAFSTPDGLAEYKNRFCKGRYCGCSIVGMLDRKYDYDRGEL
ncbi:MAG: hypothetical protein ACI3V5_00200 [Faecousia sp.]